MGLKKISGEKVREWCDCTARCQADNGFRTVEHYDMFVEQTKESRIEYPELTTLMEALEIAS